MSGEIKAFVHFGEYFFGVLDVEGPLLKGLRILRVRVDAADFVLYILAMAAHDHDHNEGSNLSEMELRVRALETRLVDKGYIESVAFDRSVETSKAL